MKKKLLISLLMITHSMLYARINYQGRSIENFLMRWAFQELCDHDYDPRDVWPTFDNESDRPANFSASDVKPGDLVFVRDCKHFFKTIHKEITVPYFILTHGEYLDKFEVKYLNYLEDKKILAWFTIHPIELKHDRVIPIPLGILQYKSFYKKKKLYYERFMQWRETSKDKLLYMNFAVSDMDWRKQILENFEKKSFCTKGHSGPFKEYMAELAEHKFVLSPPGLGPDLYRTWESVMAGTIPIVKHSYLDYMLEGLPVLFINNWDEITEEFLNKKYDEITSKTYSQETLTMEYWTEVIDKVRKKHWPTEAGEFVSLKDKPSRVLVK